MISGKEFAKRAAVWTGVIAAGAAVIRYPSESAEIVGNALEWTIDAGTSVVKFGSELVDNLLDEDPQAAGKTAEKPIFSASLLPPVTEVDNSSKIVFQFTKAPTITTDAVKVPRISQLPANA